MHIQQNAHGLLLKKQMYSPNEHMQKVYALFSSMVFFPNKILVFLIHYILHIIFMLLLITWISFSENTATLQRSEISC